MSRVRVTFLESQWVCWDFGAFLGCLRTRLTRVRLSITSSEPASSWRKVMSLSKKADTFSSFSGAQRSNLDRIMARAWREF